MADKYQGKYRIPSARLSSWNYGSAAAYFITICTKDRICYFGSIAHAEMSLSGTGRIVQQEWTKTPSLRPDMNLVLDEYVIMPNHFHAIIIIGENKYNTGSDGICRDATHRVSTRIDDTGDIANTTGIPNTFGPNQKTWHLCCADLNRPLPSRHVYSNQHLHGNPVFMITLSVMMMNTGG